jgi:hypothetical protein
LIVLFFDNERRKTMPLKAIDVHAHFSTKEGTLSTMKYAKGVAAHYSKRDVTEEQLLAFAKSDEDMAQNISWGQVYV